MHILALLWMYGFPRWFSGKESTCQCGRLRSDPWVRKIPLRRKWHPTPVFLPRKIPWTEEPGGQQSTGLQRVRHNWATEHACMYIPYWWAFKVPPVFSITQLSWAGRGSERCWRVHNKLVTQSGLLMQGLECQQGPFPNSCLWGSYGFPTLVSNSWFHGK